MTRTIYCDRGVLIVGLLGLVTFLAVLVLFLVVLINDPTGFQKPSSPARFLLTLFPLSIMAFCSCVIWIYCVHRVELSDDSIRVRMPHRDDTFSIATIERLRWHRGVHLYSAGRKISLDLSNYSLNDRLMLTIALRQAVPHECQMGWPEYCHHVAVPLFQRLIERPWLHGRPAPAGMVVVTHQRYDRMLKWLLPASLLPGIALGPWTRWISLTLFPGVVLMFWLAQRFTTPKEGCIQPDISQHKDMMPLLIICTAFMLTLPIGSLLHIAVGMDRETATNVLLILLTLYLPPFLYFGHRADKARKRMLAEEIPKSVARWETLNFHPNICEPRSLLQ